jgi:hypothetical protein
MQIEIFKQTCFASSFKKRFIVFNDEKNSFEKYEINNAL